jgi:transposase-like protein
MKRSSYTKEFKLEAVRLLESGTKGGAEIAMELGIRRNQLYKWQEEVRKNGAESSFPGKGSRNNVSDTAAENTRLKRELERVKEERDILKKAITFMARE